MKHILLILFCLSAAILAAQTPPYYPTTTLVENFGASWCAACAVAQQGLNVIEAETQAGEITIPRLLTESGEHSFDAMDERFQYYGVLGFPAVIFNGKIRVNGSDDPVADGSLYRDALNNFRFLGSPLKMAVASANHTSGSYSFDVTMVNDIYNIEEGNVVFYLVEDDVAEGLNRIVRAVQSQRIDLSGQGNMQSFNFNVSPNPAWDTANLWAVAFVQLTSKTVVQSVSTLPVPENRVRVAAPFDIVIHTQETGSYFSPLFYVYGLGVQSQITTYVETLDVPADWYINYCDVDGACYPGNTPYIHDLVANGAKAFDLNIFTGSEGSGRFNFVIESNTAATYKIPFTMQVGESSNSDALQAPALVSVQNAWPNPFRNRINFEILNAKSGLSDNLDIYNSRGQKLVTLPLKNLQNGVNQVDWDAPDLPNGVYFYRLGTTRQTGKILKIK